MTWIKRLHARRCELLQFSVIWHRRQEADAVHARLRQLVIEVCTERFGESMSA